MYWKRATTRPQERVTAFLFFSLLLHGIFIMLAFYSPKSSLPPPDPVLPVAFLATEETDRASEALKEDTVDLSSGTKGKYMNYLTHVRRRIEKYWNHNSTFATDPEERTAIIRFTIAASGELVANQVMNSSGRADLDRASLLSVSQAAPFAPIPSAYHLRCLHVIAYFRYTAPP